jgi:hypothetical protein
MGQDGLWLIQEEEEEERLRWRVRKAQGKADKKKSVVKKRKEKGGESDISPLIISQNTQLETQERFFQNVSFQPQRRVKEGNDDTPQTVGGAEEGAAEEDGSDEDEDTEYIYNQTTGVDRVDDICTPSPCSSDGDSSHFPSNSSEQVASDSKSST